MPFKPQYEGERPTLGWLVLAWIKANLIVPDGPADGEPLVFTPEQAMFILKLYEVDAKFRGHAIKGRTMKSGRLTRRAVLSRPKGFGKSPMIGAVCLTEALGPVVMDGFDADGRPVGRPWNTLGFKPKVQIVAVAEDQTANTWEPTLDMARRGPVYDNYEINPMNTFITVPRGLVEPVTSSAVAREGFRPVFAAMDQTESWITSNGGINLAATIRRNIGKLGGATVETPNAYMPGMGSVAEKSFAAYEAQIDGRTRIDHGLLFDHREAPEDTDPQDETSLRKGLAIAYGDSADVNGGWVDLDRKVQEYWDPDTDPQDARRFYLNQIRHATDAWVNSPMLRAIGPNLNEIEPLAPRDVIVLGFDGSNGRNKGVADATAIAGMRVWDGHLFTVRVWEQPDGPDGKDWSPPIDEVEGEVSDVFARYRVVGFYADPTGWTSSVAKWEAKYGKRLRVKVNEKKPITMWPRGKDTRMIDLVKAMHYAIDHQEITYDGSGSMTRHLLNARKRYSTQGYLLYKDFPMSPRKIDLAYAGCMAYKARLDAISKGIRGRRPTQTKPRRAVVL